MFVICINCESATVPALCTTRFNKLVIFIEELFHLSKYNQVIGVILQYLVSVKTANFKKVID